MAIGRISLVCAAAALFVAAGPGRAALGGDEMSIQADRIRLKGRIDADALP